MKVSKKCIQKMKNRPFLLGKIGRIWPLVFCVSLFLCFLAPGISASALEFVQPVKVRYSMGAPSVNFKVSTASSGETDYLNYYVNKTGTAADSIIGLTVQEQANWFFTKDELIELKFLVNLPSQDNTVGITDNCYIGGVSYAYCFGNPDARQFLLQSIRSVLPNKYRVNDLTFENSGLSTVMTINLFVRNDVPAPTGDIQLWRITNADTIDRYNMLAFPQGSSIQMISYNVYAVNYDNAGEVLRDQAQEEKDDTNAQVSAGDSAANSSSSDASASGTTLLAAAQSFVGALTSATPSNCNLDMDLGNLDLGNANLCSISPPPAFQVISSIVLIGFCVPLSIATAKKMVSLFRSFQN